jgi:anti-anti-sigma factor
MQVTIEDKGAIAKILLKGRLDVAGAQAAGLPLNALVDGKRGLIVDLSGVSFLASAGIRQLIVAAKSMTRNGGRLVLLNPNAEVSEVLAITGVDAIMPVARGEREANDVLAAGMGD